eukprot:CAMPEP_0202866788 /NCGR_PEP_ID=MMETSP1391-20130828/8361_1 /ASSEMBLY_ACC=CAM_ASM_000867 /TAXON_ID=1034604 /ORGANISM="Chlamydomonas leiostraca, Strain SAG 11-49" /LENGTH=367 /DNA_ID=CAMNT_0049546773 /DNA_START=89 /DNA_END=1192 /DNA_ORIENTATION=-
MTNSRESSSNATAAGLTELPEDVLLLVTKCLNAQDFFSLARSAKVFRKSLLSSEALAAWIAQQEDTLPWEQLQRIFKLIPAYQHVGCMKRVAALLHHASEDVQPRDPGTPVKLGHKSSPLPMRSARPQLQRISRCSRTPSTQAHWVCAALGLGRQEAVQALLQGPDLHPDVNYSDGAPLRLAAEQGLTEVVRELLARGARVDAQDHLALARAAGNGHVETVRALIAAGSDVRAGNNRALHAAVASGSVETVRLLLAHGAQLESMDGYSLRKAAGRGDLPMVRCLLGAGARVECARYDALFQAARAGKLVIVDLLIEAGADVASCPDAESIARQRGHKEVAARLAKARRSGWVSAPLLAVARMFGLKA